LISVGLKREHYAFLVGYPQILSRTLFFKPLNLPGITTSAMATPQNTHYSSITVDEPLQIDAAHEIGATFLNSRIM
jgi:hypothetical protein